ARAAWRSSRPWLTSTAGEPIAAEISVGPDRARRAVSRSLARARLRDVAECGERQCSRAGSADDARPVRTCPGARLRDTSVRAKELCFALGREADAIYRLRVAQRREHGVLRRAERETGGERAAVVCPEHPRERGIGDPDRQLHPLADACLDEALARDPAQPRIRARRSDRSVEQLAARQRPDRVED